MKYQLGIVLILQLMALCHASEDFRHISYEDLLQEGKLFQEEGVTTYSQLLFDVARQQVVVGARDNLFRLKLNSLTQLEHASWTAPSKKISTCQDKGQTSEDCHNFIKVLLSNGKFIFTCGTNAYSPMCTWREIENIKNVTDTLSGVAMCPYSPHANATAILSRSGGLFAGAPTDFSGADSAIYRTLEYPNLRTHQYDFKWLNDPQFVGSFETEEYVFFLFRETAVEYINCGKRIYSRIARVCKNDPGGQTLMRDTWTTFSKSRLNCSLPGEFPFYYDEIQGAVYHPEEGTVYATFTTPNNAIAGSAICAFNMSAILKAFNGPYKYQENSGSTWERQPVPHHNRQHCGQKLNSAPYQIMNNHRYQLMDDAVQSTALKPLHTSHERYTYIAVDTTPTKLHRSVIILYAATTTGHIKKISVLPKLQETCVIEVWGPLPSPPVILQYLKDTHSLYVGMQTGLLRISAVQCHRHRTQSACLNAQDPYCGWNELTMTCAQAPNQNTAVTHWHQDVTKCPVLRDSVEGGWSSWSSWHFCQYESTESGSEKSHHVISSKNENADGCQCQIRECNNPPPKHGGNVCEGPKVKVTNCTVHGGWTSWSTWSSCSQTCGLAMKTRRRTCSNPSPAFGGRVCVGPDHDEAICLDIPPCAKPAQSILPSESGQWSPWELWSTCSRPCNGGMRIRRRTCDGPISHEGGTSCPGCNFEVEHCNSQTCTETKKFSNWTPWMVVNFTAQAKEAEYTEKRFRFVCRAQTDNPSSLRIHLGKEEERYCKKDGSCSHVIGMTNTDSNTEVGWSDWSHWFSCNRVCTPGSQARTRQCESPPCEGVAVETRVCTPFSCRGNEMKKNKVEGTWSTWSQCSVSCGTGIRTKKRECASSNTCEGPNVIKESCKMPNCDSSIDWSGWSNWSNCNNDNQQYRKRQCLVHASNGVCQGANQEFRQCSYNEFTNNVSPSVQMAGVSVGAVVGSFIAGMIVGMILMTVLSLFYMKRKASHIAGSPHYITKQNPYVIVPLKEVAPKRLSSFSSNTNMNGTLRGKNNSNVNGVGSPKLYPKSLNCESATLKRNSHKQQFNSADVEQDKYY
ncbi:semaphorin-5A [Leptopilina heterotoma]|uniref:semaphorin-5A n=1 Tax=Leptopilina heterotoma TaxID=63436 RepID=UPI001CAA0893|nr:semaphorin-5A [Leptopilina heterotoma]XP_043476025.1 semaphorin-5A [Leptopilina heterotoma]